MTEKFWEKFWSNVVWNVEEEACWLWKGSTKHTKGYGSYGKKRAHRLSWEWAYGPIPEEMCILHKCDVRRCVNPRHLFIGTEMDNTEDMLSKARQAKGSKVGTSKLTEAQVAEIRALRTEKWTLKAIAERYGVHLVNIHFIVTGKTWSNTGFYRGNEAKRGRNRAGRRQIEKNYE